MACPICSKPGVPAYRPFCSKRCADVDLARWLRGDYVIPGLPQDDLSSDQAPKSEKKHRRGSGQSPQASVNTASRNAPRRCARLPG